MAIFYPYYTDASGAKCQGCGTELAEVKRIGPATPPTGKHTGRCPDCGKTWRFDLFNGLPPYRSGEADD